MPPTRPGLARADMGLKPPDGAIGLPALQARLAHDLECLQLPAPRWTPNRQHEGQALADVAIIGAGMAGLALAAALKFKGLACTVYDQADAGWEGPWASTARMETLRSPKQLAGPALGIAALTFRAWFEAQWGAAAWAALDKIPRLQWLDYLRWYRQVLQLDILNRQRITDLRPCADGRVELHIASDAGPLIRQARRVVLATGRAGLGGPLMPAFAQGLPAHLCIHCDDAFDYRTLSGKRVGVVGAGASAMDCAASALEAGAGPVHLLVRRTDIPRINKGKGAGNPGFIHGHARLPEAWKWRIRHYLHEQQVPPPRNSTLRVARQPQARFHLDCAVRSVSLQGGGLRLQTSQGAIDLDFLILATGFQVDWAQRPFLHRIAPHVRLWRDRFSAPAGQEDEELAASPDLGAHFEFQARADRPCPGLERVHCFCYPAALSQGVITGDIPAISEGAQELSIHLAALLYAEDIEHHFQRMQAFAEPEVLGDEWVVSPLPPLS